jgi:hypothetical protein
MFDASNMLELHLAARPGKKKKKKNVLIAKKNSNATTINKL